MDLPGKQPVEIETIQLFYHPDYLISLSEKECNKDSVFDHWIHDNSDGKPDVFVKELENVQGDERDIILFSVAYGLGSNGKKPSFRFGRIDRADGWKRLNVAFSRSKQEMCIFASLHGSDIPITPTSTRGRREIKAFLNYAETGRLETHDSSVQERRSTTHNGIIDSICTVLSEHGYEYVQNVGRSDFKIDIAIKNPYNPEMYLAGIMLDGETYKNTKTARDRDVAQQAVLQRLGWHLHRIWTIDWWDNRKKEIFRLLQLLDQLKTAAEKTEEEKHLKALEEKQHLKELEAKEAEAREASRRKAEEEAAERKREVETLGKAVTSTKASEEEKNEKPDHDITPAVPDLSQQLPVENKTPMHELTEGKTTENIFENKGKYLLEDYVSFDLKADKMEITDYSSPKNSKAVREVLLNILKVEAPIRKELLIRKLLKYYGVSKTKATMEATERALKAVKVKTTRQSGVVYCWLREQDPNNYRTIRGGETNKSSRNATDICQQEMKNAICHVLQTAGPMNKTALLKETSKILGYQRMTETISEAIETGFRYAKKTGEITVDTESLIKMSTEG